MNSLHMYVFQSLESTCPISMCISDGLKYIPSALSFCRRCVARECY
jgi:hypothetical protein